MLMAASGCASSSPAPSKGPEPAAANLVLWTGGTHAFTASVEDDNIIGSRISLHRASAASPDSTEFSEGPGFQGSAYDVPVNVSFSGASARGIFGSGPLNLDVIENPHGVMRIQGIVGTAQTSFEVGANHLSGYVGRCTYDMKRSTAPFRYEGLRSCGYGSARTRIEITNPILQWTPIETATLLSLALAH
ncbi:hypothetical protein LVJ94_50830 [Pendulispora rubella]|uniref:Lipoprotein n=2 Tax=Pendulispora rubella TaxID=2741070 RepID=A0ABZ2L315_9BACT